MTPRRGNETRRECTHDALSESGFRCTYGGQGSSRAPPYTRGSVSLILFICTCACHVNHAVKANS
jgi:hypothetical protein